MSENSPDFQVSESAAASIGQVLRDARDRQGLTQDQAAMRLRLMLRQIEAMEADDFESLGQPVFARGFVRNYARLLGLDPDALLARMEGAPVESAPVSHVEPPLPRSWLTSPWLILFLLGVLVMVAVPVGLYLWLNSDVDGNVISPAAVARTPAVPAPVVTPPAPVLAAQPDTSPAAVPVTPADPAIVTSETAALDAPVTPPAPIVAPVVTPAAGSVIHLEFGDDSWVEIKDASGHMLQRQLNPAGSKADIHGQPPFDVVIGNAAQVRMSYNGRPIDLKPFIAVTVARFTLEE